MRFRIEPIIFTLAGEPRPHAARKIAGREDVYRIRVGDYRVVYKLYDAEQLVVIVQVGRRNEGTYRRR